MSILRIWLGVFLNRKLLKKTLSVFVNRKGKMIVPSGFTPQVIWENIFYCFSGIRLSIVPGNFCSFVSCYFTDAPIRYHETWLCIFVFVHLFNMLTCLLEIKTLLFAVPWFILWWRTDIGIGFIKYRTVSMSETNRNSWTEVERFQKLRRNEKLSLCDSEVSLRAMVNNRN